MKKALITDLDGTLIYSDNKLKMISKKTVKMLKIKLVKGFIHKKDDQIATAISLGLRKIGAETLQPDNAATRGKIAKIAHMVEVTEVEE